MKEFLLGSEDIEKLIKAISNLQQAHTASGCPSNTLPRVGIIGGGPIALGCELDLGKILQPNLEIISITPEKRLRLLDSLLSAQGNMTHQFVPGYISDVVLYKDKNAIKSVGIIRYPGREVQYISTSLFIHIFNEHQPPGKWGTPSRHAMESITKFLDERAPENRLIRDYTIGPRDYYYEIVFRINEAWHLSLDDDEVLIKKIKFLIEQGPDQATIIASGNGPMVKRLIWLADYLGYRGQFYQVVLPFQDQDYRAVQLGEQLESEGKFVRRPIQGHLKTAMINGEKVTLEVHDSNGAPVHDVPDVDFLINAIGKKRRTHLINALIEEGYIREDDASPGSLKSTHPMLSGHYSIFRRDFVEDNVTSPGIWWKPETISPETEPYGWEEAFNIACKLLGKCA